LVAIRAAVIGPRADDLTFRVDMGKIVPLRRTERKVKTSEFFATHPVFSLDEAARALAPPRGRSGAVERLKHHLESGNVKLVARGLYAVVPAGTRAGRFMPDPFLVAAAARPDAVFSHHSALELLGVAHSAWRECTLYTPRRRRTLPLGGITIRFLDDPEPLRTESGRHMATRMVERRGRMLETTGRERTLVEGFRRPALAGGLEELVRSASAFPTLDLDLLQDVLRRYDRANLWAATGWFLERFRRTFHVPDRLLERIERHRPGSPQYLERGRRGGRLAPRWNLILPEILERPGEADEP
jgi:predicted transcriptional regulator of viral defense system